MSRLRRPVLVACLFWAGCSAPASRDIAPEDDPTGDQRLQHMLQVSDPGPARWSPVVTVPLYPVLLTADTSIKVVDATGRWIVGQIEAVQAMLGFGPPASAPRPETVDRSAEGLRQK